jgi:hypothetical protein
MTPLQIILMLPLILALLGSLLFWIVVEFLWYIQGVADQRGVFYDLVPVNQWRLMGLKTDAECLMLLWMYSAIPALFGMLFGIGLTCF